MFTYRRGVKNIAGTCDTFWCRFLVGMLVRVVLVYLLMVRGVVGRGPRGPLARHRVVVTTHGPARGYFAPRPPHYAYLGLPYARPPTPARFKAPEPPVRWDGVFEAVHRIRCVQPDGSGAEDCLVVNVFSPEHASGLPVVVHVHDGGFQRGWGSHKSPVRLLRQGFVVVTFNYRLGPFGFLCLQTPRIPGNAGLKDQVAVLYWVHRNIGKFGGNPLNVTLYGSGSGGVSVELLLLSDLVTNLVHRAIIESGATLSPSSISYAPYEVAMAEAFNLGFTGGSSSDLETFYNKAPTYSLANSSGIFLPCIENNLLSNSLLDMDPMDVLKQGIYQHVPLFISFTDAEEVSVLLDNIPKFNTIPDSFEHLLPNNLAFETDEMRQQIAELVQDFYFPDHELLDNVVQNYIDYINDVFMEYPIAKSSILHAVKSSQPVYLMKFINKEQPKDTKTSMSNVEIFNYIFSSEDEYNIDGLEAERLLTLWTNFIKLGDPTPITTALIPVIWQPVSAQDINGKVDIAQISYLQFGREMANTKPEGQQLKFWDFIYEKFYKQHV